MDEQVTELIKNMEDPMYSATSVSLVSPKHLWLTLLEAALNGVLHHLHRRLINVF